ncbi:hypothetical protein DMC25_15040 [Caulobacter sp. D4A]|nr:hypothetical protein DMC25_15040 [Caulobacter sp. D4A]
MRKAGKPGSGPPQLEGPTVAPAKPSPAFEYHAGQPTGYAGYTDYNAMRWDLNDDLVERSPQAQFPLIGFALGVVETVHERLRNAGSIPAKIPIATTDTWEGETLAWMNALQRNGVDNADPSTSNFHSALRDAADRLGKEGPRRFRNAQRSGPRESIATSGLTPVELSALLEVMDDQRKRGAALAEAALDHLGWTATLRP